MPWLTKREVARLERELKHALGRAKDAEERLSAERQRHDWQTLQLVSRLVTKHGGYGLEETKPEPPAPHPKGFTHEPTQEDLDVLEYYKTCAEEAGLPEEKATEWWETRMRGEPVYVDTDHEN